MNKDEMGKQIDGFGSANCVWDLWVEPFDMGSLDEVATTNQLLFFQYR